MKKQTFLLLFLFFIQFNLWAQPTNDNCVNAISLVPSANETCTNTAGTTVGVVSTDYDNCAEFQKRNVWYKFTATSGIHIVQVTFGTMQNGIINGFANGCGTLTPLNCGGSGQAGPVIQRVFNGLNIGQEYLVAISTREQSEEGTFDICIITPQPPTNNECSTAEALTVNTSNVPALRTNGTTVFATQSQPGCTGTADDDVWYSFVATQVSHRIFLFYTGSTLATETFSGNCGTLTSVSCSAPSGVVRSVALTGLTPGQTYFTRIYSTGSTFNDQHSFQIAITSAPQNDECANAVSVTPSANGDNSCTSSVAGSTFDATQSSLDCFGGISTSNDTWFSFIASQAVHTIKVQGFGSNVVRFQVMSGTCGSLTSLFCSVPLFVSDTALAKVGNLSPGQTYFVRVYSGNSGGVQGLFNFCVSSPEFPANDECNNAINLSVAADSTTNFINGTSKGATSFAVPGSCGGSTVLDVWYKFTATSIQHVVKAINLTNNSTLVMELFSGTCGSLVHQRCTQSAADSLFGIGNLTIGQEYVIRVYNNSLLNGDDLKIAVFTPQELANDECNNAIVIIPTTDASCNEISGTNIGATQSVNDNCTGNALIGNIRDVWFQFTASSASHRVRLIRGTGEFMRFKLYSGTCNSLTSINCSVQNTSSIIGAGIEQRFDGLTIGTIYFIRVFNTGFSELPGTFDLCVKTVVVPVNNECATATTLTPQESVTFGSFTTGNSTDATTSAQATLCSTGQDDDVWYQFTASQANMKVFLQNGTIGATRIAVYSGSCAALVLVKCQTGNTRDNVVPLTGLSVGTVYLVRVYSSATSGSQGSFSIMVTTEYNAPLNDDCITAIELFPSANNNCTATAGTTIDAAASGNASCINGNDVWFKFVATAVSHRVHVDGLVNTVFVAVFNGNCAALTQLPAACVGGVSHASVTVNSLAIGTTYFIKVLANTTASFQQSIFNICITTPQVPVNDLCTNAIALPVDNDAANEPLQIFSTNLATFSGVPNCFATGNDVWFSFVAPQEPVTIEVNALNTNPGLELLSGTCAALTSLQCNGTNVNALNNILNVSNLVQGDTYRIRVSPSTFASSDILEFKIKVYKAVSPKINASIDSICLTANLVQNPGLETDFFFPTSFIGAANPGTEFISKWRLPTRGTADFFNGLNITGSAVDIPAGLCFGNQSARNGYGYGGFFAYTSAGSREYLENELSAPMIPGKKYLVSMYVSLAEFSSIAIDNIGIALRTTQTRELTLAQLNYTAQIVSPDNVFINDKKGWINISAVVVADQPYQYLIIGNFKNNAVTDTMRLADTSQALSGGSFSGCATTSHTAYYYVDDVMVSEINGSVSGCGVLPLKLLSFTGQRVNDKIQLKWKTANEENTSHFEIQRSRNGLDFLTMGNVAAFNIPGSHLYQFDDINPFSDVNYYRLKQIDIDGRFILSNIVRITMDKKVDPLLLWPNPVTHVLNMSYGGPAHMVSIRVYDSRAVLLQSQNMQSSSNMQLDVRSLAKGMYWIEMNDGHNTLRSSFVKQ